jgi:hypothetical protein
MSRSSQPSSGPSAEAGAAGLSPRPTFRWFRRSNPLPDPGRVLRRSASGLPSALHRVAPLREIDNATPRARPQAETPLRFRELFQVFATAQSSQKLHTRRTRPPFSLDSRAVRAVSEYVQSLHRFTRLAPCTDSVCGRPPLVGGPTSEASQEGEPACEPHAVSPVVAGIVLARVQSFVLQDCAVGGGRGLRPPPEQRLCRSSVLPRGEDNQTGCLDPVDRGSGGTQSAPF